jgi:flagellar hook-associated protein 2
MATSISSTTATPPATSSTASLNATKSNVTNKLGAGSGIDTSSLAGSLVDAERAPRAAAINKNISKNDGIVSGMAAVKYVLSNLNTALADIKDVSDFKSFSISNSYTDYFTATATSSADDGTHSILVGQLATASRITGTTAFSATDDSVNDEKAMSLKVTIGGVPTFINVEAGSDTPEGIVDAINAAGVGLSAYIVNTGDADTPYQMVVTGTEGSDNAISSIVSYSGTADPITLTGTVGYSTEATSINSGTAMTLMVTNGTINHYVSIDAGSDNLTDIATALNDANLGLTATVVQSVSDDLWYITVEGDPDVVGSDFAITTYTGTVTSDTSSPTTVIYGLFDDTYDPIDLPTASIDPDTDYWDDTIQDAQDAYLTVDGISITSSSNTVTDAVPGVTLSLIAANGSYSSNTSTVSGTAGSIRLTTDTDLAKTKIKAFVTAYNDAMTLMDEVTNPKSTLDTYGATLVGNSTIRTLRDQIRTFTIDDSSTTSGSLSALRDIGIEIDTAGKLTLKETTLDSVLASSYSDVITMLTGDQEALSEYDTTTDAGISGDLSRSIFKMIATYGTVSVESRNASTRITKYQDDLAALEERMKKLLERYTQQFATMDSIVGNTKSTQTGLTSSFDGLMAMYTK